MKKVVIVQYTLPYYRISFYGHLRQYLRSAGVELRILYSDLEDKPDRSQLVKGLYADLPWGEKIPSRVLVKNFRGCPR